MYAQMYEWKREQTFIFMNVRYKTLTEGQKK